MSNRMNNAYEEEAQTMSCARFEPATQSRNQTVTTIFNFSSLVVIVLMGQPPAGSTYHEQALIRVTCLTSTASEALLLAGCHFVEAAARRFCSQSALVNTGDILAGRNNMSVLHIEWTHPTHHPSVSQICVPRNLGDGQKPHEQISTRANTFDIYSHAGRSAINCVCCIGQPKISQKIV
jgi:hypothetical protein